jgi:hypothetical protein
MSHCSATTAPVNPHLDLLARIAHETRVLTGVRYEHVALGRHRIPAAGGEESSRALIRALTDLVYSRYYLADPRPHGEPRPDAAAPAMIALHEDAEFGRALREANAGAGYFDPGWSALHGAQGSVATPRTTGPDCNR